MNQRSTILKVLSPVEGKNGKTFWMRIGSAFINRDGSTNVYLNAYPTSGKLHIRELDDRDRNGGQRDETSQRLAGGERGQLATDRHFEDARMTPGMDASQDDLPF